MEMTEKFRGICLKMSPCFVELQTSMADWYKFIAYMGHHDAGIVLYSVRNFILLYQWTLLRTSDFI